MGSIETVTILFTDLVGSTGLETRIGPGPADELRAEHFALLRSALSDSGGREVKNTGDGVMAAFESAAAAAECAVLMQQRFDFRNRQEDAQLVIRVGISLGDATSEGGDYFGVPVIEAARLCDRAQGGQILAKEVLAHLTGGRSELRFRAIGEMELKGIPEPVSTVELGWEPLEAPDTALPLPARLRRLPPATFVGRAGEREALSALLAEVQEGWLRVALLAGEPGIGKTRLSTHTAIEARAAGATVLYGRADEELALPYGSWIEALRHYVEHAPEESLRAHVGAHGGELVRLVPQLGQRIADLPSPQETDPDTERYLLWNAVLGLLSEASRSAPVVLVLDDLHWADKPTLQLLKHVVAHGAAISAIVIGTYRDSDVGRGDPLAQLLADLRREPGVTRFNLKGLDAFEITELMERAAGHELDEAGRTLALELHRETDGNAFYTGELLRHLLESGAVGQDEDGRWTVRGDRQGLGLPESLREVIGQRVERLGHEVHQVLGVAAVIGREFEIELLRRLTDRPSEELLDLLEEAARASLVAEMDGSPGRFSFSHALVTHTLYEELSAARRAHVHRQIAEALEEMLGDDPGERIAELAQHWESATTPSDIARAADYARRAGQRAQQDLAPEEAVRWFARALELTSQRPDADPAERCDLLISLGEAERDAGEPAFRETLLEASRLAGELHDADRAAKAALANSRGVMSRFGAVDTERIAAIDAALEIGGPAEPARRARLLALKAAEMQVGPEVGQTPALVREAVDLARESGDTSALADTLRGATLALFGPQVPLEVRKSYAHELEQLGTTLNDPALLFFAALALEDVLMESGEVQRAADPARRSREIAERLGQPSLSWLRRYRDAGRQSAMGNLAETERLAQEAFDIGMAGGQPDAAMVFGGPFAFVRDMQGRYDEIIDLLEQAADANPGLPVFRAGLASILAAAGRHDQASDILEVAAKDQFAHVPRDLLYLTTLSLYAQTAAFVRASAPAELLYELLLPLRDRVIWASTSCYGLVELYLGRLADVGARDALTDEHLARACELQRAQGMRYWAAYAHVSWAESLGRRAEHARARAEAEKSLEVSAGQGYGAIERRAAAVLADATSAPTS